MEHGRLQDHSEEGGYGSQHRWASTSISMSEISDIDISYSDIGDKYVGLKNVIPISEVFRYRHQSSFRYPTLKKKIISPQRFEPAPLGMVSEHYITALLYLSVRLRMSDIGQKFIPISNIMLDSALSVRYRKFRYQAQSDIADHGFRTKCPPMAAKQQSADLKKEWEDRGIAACRDL